jgi:nicotinamidase-related amidase
MSHSRTALLVIDAQQSFEHRPYWNESDAPAFFDRLQALVDGAKARHIPMAQIFHIEESGAFSLASGYIQTLAALSISPDVVFHKYRHSALVGSGLPVWLTEQGIQHLIVSGIRTEQCCDAACVGLRLQRGFRQRSHADICYDRPHRASVERK